MVSSRTTESLDPSLRAASGPLEWAAGQEVLASGEGTVVISLTTAEQLTAWRPFWSANISNLHTDLDFYELVCRFRSEVQSPYILAAIGPQGPCALLIGRVEEAVVPLKLGYLKIARPLVRQLVFVPEGLLGDRSAQSASLFVQAIQAGIARAGAQMAVLSNVSDDSPFHAAWRQLPLLSRGLVREDNEHWCASLPESLDQFLQGRSKKHRYWLRRIGKVFEKAFPGEVKYEQLQGPEAVDSFCRAADKIASTTYQRGLGVGFRDDQETRSFVRVGAERGWWTAYLVYVQERPVAFWSGMLHLGVYHVVWTAYDPAFGSYEPGSIVFLRMVDHLCQRGVRQMDFGVGEAFYKRRYGDKLMMERSLRIYGSGLRPRGLNLSYSAGIWVNRTLQTALKRLQLADRIKRILRRRAAATAGKDGSKPAAEAGAEE